MLLGLTLFRRSRFFLCHVLPAFCIFDRFDQRARPFVAVRRVIPAASHYRFAALSRCLYEPIRTINRPGLTNHRCEPQKTTRPSLSLMLASDELQSPGQFQRKRRPNPESSPFSQRSKPKEHARQWDRHLRELDEQS
jgi:hypothetical protein